MLVGDADLEDPQLTETLGFLRSTAAALSPGGVTSKLVLPDSQILYTTVSAPGPDDAARRDQIAEALTGRTPYAVADLVFDWRAEGELAQVAVVTKLTLAEAEAFAEEHGFNPLCFVAIPEEASFGGEPFFGQTTRADEHMPSGAALERDDSPVRIIGRIELPRGPVAAEPDAAAHAAPVEAPPADMAEPDEMTDEPAEAGKALPVGLPEARESPEPHVVAADLPAAAPADEPVALPGADTALTLPDAPAAEPSVDASSLGEDVAEPTAAEEPAGGFASRRGRTAPPQPEHEAPAAATLANVTARIALENTGPAKPARLGPATELHGVTDPVVPVPRASAPAVPADAIAARQAGRRGRTAPAGPHAPHRALLSPESAAEPPPPPLRRRPKSAAEISEEMTVFGARRPNEVGGKPRHMGLALFGGLAVVMAAVALWSLWSGDEPATLPQGDALSTTAPADQPTAETGAAGAPTADDTVIQPEPDTAPASGEPSAPAETAAEPATPAQSADTGPSEAGAASSVPAAVPTAVDQADPIVAQSLPDASAAAQVANEDAMPAAARTGALPEDGTLLHDLTPLAPAEPVPYGSLVRFDAQGFVIATPEGVITPGGFRLVAGKPPLRPAERPEAVAAAAAATPAAATPGPSDAVAPAAAPGATSGSEPAPVWADPKLRGKRPQPRPADLAVPADQGAAEPATEPSTIAVQTAGDGPRPKARPGAIVAAAATQAEEAAAPVAGGSQYAVASSRRPASRPSDLSVAVENAIAAAVAEPLPEPAVSAPSAKPEAAAAPEPAPEPAPTQTAEIDEPEPTSAAPNIPTQASVAKQATFANAIDLGKVNLIGIYGSQSNRRALIRTGNGRFVKVKVGDRFDGGKVAAIGDGQLTYVKNGKTIVLKMVKAG